MQRSRFLGFAAPLPDHAGLQGWLAALRRGYPDARHCPHAWVAADGASVIRSDDGEPGDTGGRPCLAALQRLGVRGAAVAVVRIFGGVRLGTGNLRRAYASAAAEAVDGAGLATVLRWQQVAVEVAFAELGRVEDALARAGARDVERQYEDGAVLFAWLPAAAIADLQQRVPRVSWRLLAQEWR